MARFKMKACILVLFIASNVLTFYFATVKLEVKFRSVWNVDQKFSNSLVLITKEVIKAKRYARSGKTTAHLIKAYQKLDELLKNLEVQKLKDEENHTQLVGNTKQLVCPEIFKGVLAGYPFYQRQGWEIEPCSNVPPFNTVITILLNFKNKGFDKLKRVLRGLETFYPTLTVFVATDTGIPESLETNKMNLVVRRFKSEGKSHGVIWNELVRAATTNYVLIGRDINRITWDIRLERMIRIASNLRVDIVGGAVRTPDGHWSTACRQFVMLNYTLAYIEGYDMSRNSCLYCEHLVGPFVGRTEAMKSAVYYKVDEDLDSDVVFEDLFIRIKRNDQIAMSCPDSLFFIDEKESRKEIKQTWLPLIRKWGLSKVHLYNKKIHSYTCEVAGMSCSPWDYRNMILPVCCVEILSKAMSKVFEVCDKNKIICESQSGNGLGSVKFNGVLPWEKDADIFYAERNHSLILGATNDFTGAGFTLSEGIKPDFSDPNHKNGYFALHASGWRLELFAKPKLPSMEDIKDGINQTRVYTDGYWHPFPLNPGMYVRGRYGVEVFKHAQHWSELGSDTGWYNYKPGAYGLCPKPGHHACLDSFLGDGNIQFKGPWL